MFAFLSKFMRRKLVMFGVFTVVALVSYIFFTVTVTEWRTHFRRHQRHARIPALQRIRQ